jgi:ABC-type multidrug transport system fused ATPase/permease subunit
MISLLNKIILIILNVHKGTFKSLSLIILIIFNTFIEALGIAIILYFIKILINDKILENYLQIINNYLSSNKYFIFSEDLTKQKLIIIFILFIILIYTARFLFSIFYIKKLSNYNSYLEEVFSNKLYKNFLNKDYEYYLNINSNIFLRDLIANINLLTAVISFYFYLLSETIILIILLIILISKQPFLLSFIFILLIFLISLFFFLQKNKIKKIGDNYQSHMADKVKIITETFYGIKEIINYKHKSFFYNNFKLVNNKKSEPTQKLFIANTIIRPYLEYIFIVFILTLTILTFYFDKNDVLDLSNIIVFLAISIRLIPCVSRILSNIQNINYRRSAANSVINQLNISFSQSNISKKNEHQIFSEFKNKIEFRNIIFFYKNDQTLIINKADFSIKKYSKNLLLGKSGSGKSTVLDIFAGLLKINSGEIYVDNKIIDKNEYNLKNKISYVTQKSFLTNDSIKQNICLGKQNELVNIDLLNKCVEILELDNYFLNLNKQIGENGIKLSGGERQKVIIARAIYNNPDILILDEATNAMDSKTEYKILTNIIKEFKDITLILTSHKDVPSIKFDNILILQDGKIKESKE